MNQKLRQVNMMRDALTSKFTEPHSRRKLGKMLIWSGLGGVWLAVAWYYLLVGSGHIWVLSYCLGVSLLLSVIGYMYFRKASEGVLSVMGTLLGLAFWAAIFLPSVPTRLIGYGGIRPRELFPNLFLQLIEQGIEGFLLVLTFNFILFPLFIWGVLAAIQQTVPGLVRREEDQSGVSMGWWQFGRPKVHSVLIWPALLYLGYAILSPAIPAVASFLASWAKGIAGSI